MYKDYSGIIADDHDAFRNILAGMIKSKFPGLRLDEASNGPGLIALVRQNDYHFIIADHLMPKQTGLEAIAQIRGLRQSVPIALLTLVEKSTLLIPADIIYIPKYGDLTSQVYSFIKDSLNPKR